MKLIQQHKCCDSCAKNCDCSEDCDRLVPQVKENILRSQILTPKGAIRSIKTETSSTFHKITQAWQKNYKLFR